MRERLTLWLCGVAWRILWRWWPDRHYVITSPHREQGVLWETVDPAKAASWKAAFYQPRERLDHAGRPVKFRAPLGDGERFDDIIYDDPMGDTQ